MKSTWLATLMIIGLVAFTTLTSAQEHDHSSMSEHPTSEPSMSGHDMHSNAEKSVSDKARCAIEGMMMKKSVMKPLEHGDETLYFCSEAQKAMFQKVPKRYLKKLTVGHNQVLMNTLTMKEYMDMMKSMGMGRMMKKPGANDTHWISTYLDVDGQPVELSGITAKIVTPGGKTVLQELKYDKMMKTYTGNLSLPESGKYKISLLLESSATE